MDGNFMIAIVQAVAMMEKAKLAAIEVGGPVGALATMVLLPVTIYALLPPGVHRIEVIHPRLPPR